MGDHDNDGPDQQNRYAGLAVDDRSAAIFAQGTGLGLILGSLAVLLGNLLIPLGVFVGLCFIIVGVMLERSTRTDPEWSRDEPSD